LGMTLKSDHRRIPANPLLILKARAKWIPAYPPVECPIDTYLAEKPNPEGQLKKTQIFTQKMEGKAKILTAIEKQCRTFWALANTSSNESILIFSS
jgi:hypothetical protein